MQTHAEAIPSEATVHYESFEKDYAVTYFNVMNQCARPVQKGVMRPDWKPRSLMAYFKKIDTADCVVTAYDNRFEKLVSINLLEIDDNTSRKSFEKEGPDMSILLSRYLKIDSDRKINQSSILFVRPNEARNFEFTLGGLGHYIVMLRTIEEDTLNDRVFFHRLEIRENKMYKIVFSQMPKKGIGFSKIIERDYV